MIRIKIFSLNIVDIFVKGSLCFFALVKGGYFLFRHPIGLEPITCCFEGNCCTNSAKDVIESFIIINYI